MMKQKFVKKAFLYQDLAPAGFEKASWKQVNGWSNLYFLVFRLSWMASRKKHVYVWKQRKVSTWFEMMYLLTCNGKLQASVLFSAYEFT